MQERHRNNKQYFDELAHSTQKYIIPYISQFTDITEKTRVLEIGCGPGGNLKPFIDMGCEVVGFDLDAGRIKQASDIFDVENNEKVRLFCEDVFKVKNIGLFDVIIVRDVIEHISDKKHFFEHIKDFMHSQSVLYFTFPAWYMPFGGHQQIAKSKFLSVLPFFHLLPSVVYEKILEMFGENEDTVDELLDIKKCKISIEQFRNYARSHKYEVVGELFYFINPHYEVKFGLRPRKLNKIITKLPFVRNFFTTGCFYVLKIKDSDF